MPKPSLLNSNGTIQSIAVVGVMEVYAFLIKFLLGGEESHPEMVFRIK